MTHNIILLLPTASPLIWMSIPQVILPCPQTHSSWLNGGIATSPHILDSSQSFSRDVSYTFSNFYLFIHLWSQQSSPWPALDRAPLWSPWCHSFLQHSFLESVTLKHKSYCAISILTVLFCHIFSLVSQLSLFGVLFSSTPSPSSLPNAPRAHVTVPWTCCSFQTHPNSHPCWDTSFACLTYTQTISCVPSPKCFPPVSHLSHCYRGRWTRWSPHLKRVDPWEWGHVFCNSVFCVWHIVGTNKPLWMNEWMNKYRVWHSSWLYHEERLLNILFLLLRPPHHEILSGHLLLSLSVFQQDMNLGDPRVNHLQQPQCFRETLNWSSPAQAGDPQRVCLQTPLWAAIRFPEHGEAFISDSKLYCNFWVTALTPLVTSQP